MYPSLAFLSLSVIPLSQAASYELYNRFLPHPTPQAQPHSSDLVSIPEWIQWGTINYDTTSLNTSFERVQISDAGTFDDGRGFWQVGIETERGWITSFTKSCYTAAPQPYSLILHLTKPDAEPTALEIHLPAAGIDGDCPRGWHAEGDRHLLPNPWGLNVELRFLDIVEGPNLAPPPPINPETGTPSEPVPEKSFLQKYWVPLLGLGFFALTYAGGDTPQAGGAGGGGAAAAK